jgi:HlyD family secretion protein
MKWKRWIIPTLIGAAVIAAVAWGLRPQPVMVETAEVKRAPLRVTVEEEGKTRVKERYVVSSPITGQMQRIDLNEGDPIRSGQRLTAVMPLRSTFLDPRTRAQGQAAIAAAESQIAAARQRVISAKANVNYWRTELDRNAKLMADRLIARSQYEQVSAQQQQAVASLREAEAALETENAGLRKAVASMEQPSAETEHGSASVPVVAPVAGRILRLVRNSAGPVTAGEALVEVGNSHAIEVEVDLLSPDAVKAKPGTRVLFTRWGGDKELEGRVQRIEPDGQTKISALGVEEQRVPVIVNLTSPEPEWHGLGSGYRVEASFILWEAEDVLQIPSSAVFRYQSDSAVFVVEGKVARRRVVKLGRRAGLDVQVLEGVKPGEQIISHPDNSIEDGKLIQPR